MEKDKLDSIRWFHQIPLGEGFVTPGIDHTGEKLGRIKLPHDLAGKRVLDVGAWDGFFSFECERRNAREVVALDSYCWGGDGWGTKDGFNCARDYLGSKVKDVECEVHNIDPAELGFFEVVLMLGVLYHIEDPMRCLRAISSVNSDLLILETSVDLLPLSRPAFAFYPGNELNSDPTNWWAPNIAGLLSLLKVVGYKHVEIVSKPSSWYKRIWRMPSPGNTWLRSIQSGRICVHAFKGSIRRDR